MKRRTLLAAVGTGSIIGAAGCFGASQLMNGDGDGGQKGNEEQSSNGSAENGSDRAQSDGNGSEGNGSDEKATDQESNESGEETNESSEGQEDDENNETESNESDDSSSRPDDPVDTISVDDHGLEIQDSPEQGVDKEIYCYGKFTNGEHALRKVRVDGVVLAKDGTRLDHSWKPFARLEPGEQFEVRFRFFVSPDEIHEYLVGATEATYVEGEQ